MRRSNRFAISAVLLAAAVCGGALWAAVCGARTFHRSFRNGYPAE